MLENFDVQKMKTSTEKYVLSVFGALKTVFSEEMTNSLSLLHNNYTKKRR